MNCLTPKERFTILKTLERVEKKLDAVLEAVKPPPVPAAEKQITRKEYLQTSGKRLRDRPSR